MGRELGITILVFGCFLLIIDITIDLVFIFNGEWVDVID
jgi:hypothetical protein